MNTYQKEKADAEPIVQAFTDMIRSCMRVATGGGEAHIDKATESWVRAYEAIEKSGEINPFLLINETIKRITPEPTGRADRDALLDAAKMGMRVVVESSCDGPSARARTRKREKDFVRTIDDLEGIKKRAKARGKV